ncbi:MAG: hypothetical protein JO035_17830 [Betaproteobacteria bacterium]|nr:hypothetical protein [Betaproteobacteria bacterium]
MRIFYVRPARDGGYGRGDGTSYEHAWNGFTAVDWQKVRSEEPATVWVCGNGERPTDFMTVQVELSYLQENKLAA